MAWLSVGNNNDELIAQMKDHGVLDDDLILDAFRQVDRGDFVKKEDRSLTYLDRPFKKGFIHISAPHMYATVLRSLDLKPGLSFLNIGSGSGYLSCLASCFLGKYGINHGVEICKELVEFSKASIDQWLVKQFPGSKNLDVISIVQGNCFDIDLKHSSNSCRYDRIYVGAACPVNNKEFFFHLLSEGGILVLPILEKGQLVQIKKIKENIFVTKFLSHVHFSSLIETEGKFEFNDNLISENIESEDLNLISNKNVTYYNAELIPKYYEKDMKSSVHLPKVYWGPSKDSNLKFPFEFKKVVRLFVFCSGRSNDSSSLHYQAKINQTKPCISACQIPQHIWFYILSFCSREWFRPITSTVDLLRTELIFEKQKRKETENRLIKSEELIRYLQRERDLLRTLLNKAQDRKMHETIYYDLEEDNDEEFEEDDDESDEIEEVVELNEENLETIHEDPSQITEFHFPMDVITLPEENQLENSEENEEVEEENNDTSEHSLGINSNESHDSYGLESNEDESSEMSELVDDSNGSGSIFIDLEGNAFNSQVISDGPYVIMQT